MQRNFSTMLLACFTLALLTVLASSTTYGQSMAEPTPEHESLKQDVGIWDAKIQLWLTPDSDPITGTGTETNRMMGPMWLVNDFEGEVMGFSFTGHGQNGYDPVKNKYVGTWIDSNTPYLSIMEGTMDKSGKVLTMLSKSTNPETKKAMVTKMVITVIDHDHKNFKMFDAVEGEKDQWTKSMEIDYTRSSKNASEKESLK